MPVAVLSSSGQRRRSLQLLPRLLPMLLLLLLLLVGTTRGVILRPFEDAQGVDVALVVLAGANVPAARYAPLGRAIQKALAPDLRLWVGIPDEEMIDGRVVDDAIYNIKLELESAGMKAQHNFISGHSLGGVRSQEHAKAHAGDWDGQVLMAACLLRVYDNATFPLPTLTVGGEKDGNMRVSRMAQSSHIYRRQGADVAARFPVVVVPGANHMSFASGTPPVNVAAVDLTPEISREEGHATIAAVVADFVRGRVAAAKATVSGGGDGPAMAMAGAGQDLAAALRATAELIDPLVEAMLLEGSWRFDAPCNSDHPSPHCPFYPAWPEQPEARASSNVTACVCGSPWVEQVAQAHVGDLEGYATYVVRDAFHDVRDTEPYHHAHLWNNCSADELLDETCVLNITTVTELVYSRLDDLDIGFFPVTASEMKVKMKSRQATYQQTIDPAARLADTDRFPFCAEINEKAFQWALERAPARTRARFGDVGVWPVFDPDIRHAIQIGPVWINSPLILRERYDTTIQKWVLHVQSPAMVTDVTAHIYPDSAGFHYCKLLSPARIMEWIYVDGLRRNDRASDQDALASLLEEKAAAEEREEQEGAKLQLLRGAAAAVAQEQ